MLVDVCSVVSLHYESVVRWHQSPIYNPFDGYLATVCTQHGFNFRLWHEEDIARSPLVSDARIAEVKRAIDKLNQQRNDWIEKLDDWLTQELNRRGIVAAKSATQNTETPCSVIDRLSILALRIFHFEEQTLRTDAPVEHLESVNRTLAICRTQRDDLSRSLDELLMDIEAGRKLHKTYRQFKMYNVEQLNPQLYGARRPSGSGTPPAAHAAPEELP